MRYAVISCQVLCREISRLVAESGNSCTPFFVEQGLHNTPELLNRRLSELVETISSMPGKHGQKHMFDAILLGYGLCCNGIIGLIAKEIPIITPRCDDCIALLLGSYQRYLELFRRCKSAYWFSSGWMEYGSVPTLEEQERKRADYVERFGEENAEYLMEQEASYIKEYSHAIYIRSPESGPDFNGEETVRQTAEAYGWKFLLETGSDDFLRDLLSGRHDDRFLICPPGYKIAPTFDEQKIKAIPCESGGNDADRLV